MAEETNTLAALDEAVREHATQLLSEDGEVVVAWLAIAAVRRYDGGGTVICMPSNEVMPRWEAKGILQEAMDAVRESED